MTDIRHRSPVGLASVKHEQIQRDHEWQPEAGIGRLRYIRWERTDASFLMADARFHVWLELVILPWKMAAAPAADFFNVTAAASAGVAGLDPVSSILEAV